MTLNISPMGVRISRLMGGSVHQKIMFSATVAASTTTASMAG